MIEFTASDLLKVIEIAQDEDYTPADFSEHIEKIESFVAILKK